jgi:hypothetical protein
VGGSDRSGSQENGTNLDLGVVLLLDVLALDLLGGRDETALGL